MQRTDFANGLRLLGAAVIAFAVLALPASGPVSAQSDTDWMIPGAQVPSTPSSPGATEAPPAQFPDTENAPPAQPAPATEAAPAQAPDAEAQTGEAQLVRLVARLTIDGEPIDQGIVWRVFAHLPGGEGKSTLAMTKQDASPTVKLRPGDYVVIAAFGRAHITRRIAVRAGAAEPAVEDFVLNAGGLRVKALVAGADAPSNSVNYSIYSDRDQTDNRKLVISSAKPGLIMRLNAGIYHIVSTYGDCNAVVSSDVTVEAGKLTETTITHSAAKATFKLVPRAGGEALPDTQWTIQTLEGQEIKESVGALPTHILAPGTYEVIAKSQGRNFQREVTLADGETTQVELVMN